MSDVPPTAEEIEYAERVEAVEKALLAANGGAFYLTFDLESIVNVVFQYTLAMQAGDTSRWCSCTWRFHPDDVQKPEDERRKMKIEEHPFCPVHTKEGLILGFLKWINREIS